MSFAALDAYLGEEFSDDYWSDDGVSHACHIIEHFLPEDWEKLRSSWTNREEIWQIRCAQTLAHGQPREAIAVAMDFVRSGPAEVRLAALDSMREMDLAVLASSDAEWLLHEVNGMLSGLNGDVISRAVLLDLIRVVEKTRGT